MPEHARRRYWMDPQILPIQEALEKNSVTDGLQERIRHFLPRALNGEFLYLSPPGIAEDIILFFQPPTVFSTSSIYPQLFPDDKPPQIVARRGFAQKSQDFVNNFWILLNRYNRYIDSYDPIALVATRTLIEVQKDILVPLSDRFTQNFKNAATFTLNGYKGRMRRTGEPFGLHSLRTFISLFADRMPHSIDQIWILYITLLASLLHDGKEDFREFSLTPKSPNSNEYTLSAKAINGRPIQTILKLKPIEAKLLQMQLEALTAPSVPEGTPQKVTSIKQFEHLQQQVGIIADSPEFGPLAAFYTLLIKWKDRFDNLCTYWSRGEDGKIVVDKNWALEKLTESYLFFRTVESDAKFFLTSWANQPGGAITLYSKKEGAKREMEIYLDSVVRFCERLLYGGQHTAIFQASYQAYLNEYNEIGQIVDSKKRKIRQDEFSLYYPFFLPTPQPIPKKVNILHLSLREIIQSSGLNPLELYPLF